MGSTLSLERVDRENPESVPKQFTAPTFPPDYGFDGPRKKRVMKITDEEMDALQLQPKMRDYCAHDLATYLTCRRAYDPFHIACKQEFHHLTECRKEDYFLRMKEYERERRLRVRKLKAEGKSIE